MGVTIYSKNCAADCGYGGLQALRQKVADLTDPEIGSFYRELGQLLMTKVTSLYYKPWRQPAGG